MIVFFLFKKIQKLIDLLVYIFQMSYILSIVVSICLVYHGTFLQDSYGRQSWGAFCWVGEEELK